MNEEVIMFINDRIWSGYGKKRTQFYIVFCILNTKHSCQPSNILENLKLFFKNSIFLDPFNNTIESNLDIDLNEQKSFLTNFCEIV